MEPQTEPELPEICQGVLDSDRLWELANDLNRLTQIHEISIKGGDSSLAERTGVTLEAAVESLLQGRIRGVQVWYTWNETVWADTLLGTPEGVKIVRMPQVREF